MITKRIKFFLVLACFLGLFSFSIQTSFGNFPNNDVGVGDEGSALYYNKEVIISVLQDSPVVHFDANIPGGGYGYDSFSECDAVRFETNVEQGSFSEDNKFKVMFYVDDELVLNKIGPIYAGGAGDVSNGYEFNFTLRQKLLSPGKHVFKAEVELLNGIDADTSNNSIEKDFTVTSCEVDPPISSGGAGHQIWGGIVTSDTMTQGGMPGAHDLVDGAYIDVNGGEYSAETGEDGRWWLSLPKGKSYNVVISKPGYSKRYLILEDGDSYYAYTNLADFKNQLSWLPGKFGINHLESSSYDISDIYDNVAEDDWYTPYLKNLIRHSYFPGTLAGNKVHFDAGQKMLRKDLIKTLILIVGANYNDVFWDPSLPAINVDKVFCDEKGDDMSGYLAEAIYMYYNDWLEGSLKEGCSLPVLNANAELNRVEALAFIYRVLEIDLSNDGSVDVSMFSDVSESDWYAPIVSQNYKDKIIAGYPDGTFKPGNTVNMAEFAKMYSMIDEVYGEY